MNPMLVTDSPLYKAALASLIAVFIMPAYGWTDSLSTSAPGVRTIQITPAFHDFGDVIPTIGAEPVLFTISNQGGEALEITSILLSDRDNFFLSVGGGPKPCWSTSPVIASGGTCTFTVTYLPQQEGFFNATLTVTSNDNAMPEQLIYLKGSATICGC